MKNALMIVTITVMVLGGFVYAPATEAATQAHLTASIEDLGIKDPGLLPTNPFYFLKEWGRGLKRALTFKPISKVRLELQIADEKAAEAKRLEEIRPDDTRALTNALEDYQEQQDRVTEEFEKLDDTAKNPEVEALLDLVTEKAEIHERVLRSIEEKFNTNEQVMKLIDEASRGLEVFHIKEEGGLDADTDAAPAAFGAGGKGELVARCFELEQHMFSLKQSVSSGEVTVADYNTKAQPIREKLNDCYVVAEPTTPMQEKPAERILCTMEYAPVCAVNGKTYSNACHARAAGVAVSYTGECKAPTPPVSSCGQIQCLRYDPVCGANGKTYSCGEADASSCGVKVSYVGECKVEQPAEKPAEQPYVAPTPTPQPQPQPYPYQY